MGTNPDVESEQLRHLARGLNGPAHSGTSRCEGHEKTVPLIPDQLTASPAELLEQYLIMIVHHFRKGLVANAADQRRRSDDVSHDESTLNRCALPMLLILHVQAER